MLKSPNELPPGGYVVTALLLGLGFFGIAAVWASYNTFVPIMLAQVGLNATGVGFVMTWDNYLNLMLQPLVGFWSDRTRSRLGRRKPWLLAGAPLAAISFMAVPVAPTLALLLLAILLTNLGMALFRSPTVALLGDVFSPAQRSQANGIISLMGGIGAIIALIGGGVAYRYNPAAPFVLGGVTLLTGVTLLLLTVPEPPAPVATELPAATRRGIITRLRAGFAGYSRATLLLLAAIMCAAVATETVQTWLSSFGQFTLGLNPGRLATVVGYSYALPGLLFAVPSGLLGHRFGRRRVMLSGFGLLALLFMGGGLAQSEGHLIGLLIPAGMAASLISVNALPALFDTAPTVGPGTLTGAYYFATNAAAVLGPQLTGLLINQNGQNYRVMFMVGAVAMTLAGVLLRQVQNPGLPSVVEQQ